MALNVNKTHNEIERFIVTINKAIASHTPKLNLIQNIIFKTKSVKKQKAEKYAI